MVRATALVLALASAVAQGPPRFPSDVELVYVTVGAHDKQGRPVTDLQPADVAVREDGKARVTDVLAPAGTAPAGDDRTAVDACVLVDTSGSVGTTAETFTAEALRVLSALPRIRRRCLVSFDNDVRVWRAEADPAELARDIKASRAPHGATALNTALVTALGQLGDGPGRAVILLLSDGEDVGSRVSQAQALDALQRSRAVVYPLTHGAQESMSLSPGANAGSRPLSGGNTGVASWNSAVRFSGPAYLSRLAELSGGRVLRPGDGSIAEVLAHVGREIAAHYVLGFAPASLYPGAHKLKLTVARKDVKLRYRPAFVVAEPPAR